MKINLKLPIIIIFFSLFTLSAHVFAQSASAARFFFGPSGGEVFDQLEVEVGIDTEGEAVESAVAIATYNPNHINIISISANDFFDNIDVDATTSGELVITGTLNLENTDGVTGSGKMATMILEPKITSGTFELDFRCNTTETDDSNIMNINGTNLLATDEQCAQNVSGSYTVESETESPTATTEATTKGDQPVMPDELAVAGPMNWLKWLVSGLAMIGVGLLLL